MQEYTTYFIFGGRRKLIRAGSGANVGEEKHDQAFLLTSYK